MITDLEAVLIHNSRVAQANAQAAVYDAYAVANRNARVARENAQAAAAARADADYVSDEYDKLLQDHAALQRKMRDLESKTEIAVDFLADCIALLDAHGIEIPRKS